MYPAPALDRRVHAVLEELRLDFTAMRQRGGLDRPNSTRRSSAFERSKFCVID
jgi:hypothetical protein